LLKLRRFVVDQKSVIQTEKEICKDYHVKKMEDLRKEDWYSISEYQPLSEPFIEKFEDKVNWNSISVYQPLSEPFIEKWKDKVDWDCISECQSLSEPFIEKWKDKVNWDLISEHQPLSEPFIEKWKDNIDLEVQKRKHSPKSFEKKLKEIKEYAKTHNLEFDGDGNFLYAFRNHDKRGCGLWNKTIFYKPSIYYRDWHCDMDKSEENSFGLGIWPKGNTKVKVKVDDWGVSVGKREDGKARVWGFEVVG